MGILVGQLGVYLHSPFLFLLSQTIRGIFQSSLNSLFGVIQVLCV